MRHTPAMAFHGFGPDAVEFFVELGAHNDRPWWTSQRERYRTSVADPLAALADELVDEFGPVHVFRPNRDVRFSADKRPYKEQAAFVAGHGDGQPGGGSLYLQLSADGLALGGGWWTPGAAQLAAFRTAVDDPAVAADLRALLAELARTGLELDPGDPVATAPRGWSREHPQIALLRRRRLAVLHALEPGPWLATDEVVDVVRRDWRLTQRFVGWLQVHAAVAD